VILSLSEDGKVMTKTVRFAATEKGFDDMEVFDKISDRVRLVGYRTGESIADVRKDGAIQTRCDTKVRGAEGAAL
jgi:hypothetical protein